MCICCYSYYMKAVLLKLKKLLRLAKSFFPTSLPKGVTEFHAWADDIIDLSGAPDNDSVKFALATNILHASPTAAIKPKFHYILLMKKAMANQVASHIINETKARQENEREEERLKRLKEQDEPKILPK